ncbi:histone-binding protein MSI1 [Artemisia annua]|uniref:Histone-binding protein MSI1 n=1 Tax=Artemisia annua TaxID=35608 RepID=A0A2U1Q7T5_ARTAN|nr:histone-binding protein MSI1 [Artemisia annua]
MKRLQNSKQRHNNTKQRPKYRFQLHLLDCLIANTKNIKDGPSELLFLHGGHTNVVSDSSWKPCEDWTVASVAADNSLQIWRLAETSSMMKMI